MIYRAYKVQLDINDKQQTLLRQHLGCARWAYNWAMEKKKEAFDRKEKIPGKYELHKELNKIKENEVPWMYESSKAAPQLAIHDCDTAFKNFFDRCRKKVKGKKGFPKFKSRKNDKQSFRLIGIIRVADKEIQLPVIGKLKLTEAKYIPSDHKILSATVSHKAGRWFIAVNTESPDPIFTKTTNNIIGVDLGIKTLATCSDGTAYANPKALANNLDNLKRKQRQLNRKDKDSNRYNKAKQRLANTHYRISNIRKDALHKATSKIVHENQVIVLEDLKVSNMLRNHCLARAISDVGFYEFRRQIEYKARWHGREVVVAPTFFPSSKLCSCCGWKDEDLKLSDRVFRCKNCDNTMVRDLNASRNLVNYYRGSLSQINARGDGSSIEDASPRYSLSVKREFNTGSELRLKA